MKVSEFLTKFDNQFPQHSVWTTTFYHRFYDDKGGLGGKTSQTVEAAEFIQWLESEIYFDERTIDTIESTNGDASKIRYRVSMMQLYVNFYKENK